MPLTLLVGPTAVGKTVLWRELITKHHFLPFKTCTTRLPREEELIEGAIPNYHFLTKPKFEEMIQQGYFFEYVEHVGNYYGTSALHIEKAIQDKEHWVGVVEIRGAINIKKSYPEVFTIFIAPPSEEELKRRIKTRGTETEEEINERLKIAFSREIPNAHQLDFTVINENIEETLLKIIEEVKKFHSQKEGHLEKNTK